ncbi:transposase, partial [Bacillus subtilis]
PQTPTHKNSTHSKFQKQTQETNQNPQKETRNRRNGYGKKIVKTTAGEVEIAVPRDRV